MIAKQIHIAPPRATRRAAAETVSATIEPMIAALACAAPAFRRGVLGLLLRAAAEGDRHAR